MLLQTLWAIGIIFLIGGCSEYNRIPTVAEKDSLSNIVQLTDGFTRAGEANFCRDLRWIAFRGVLAGQKQYQLYLAKVTQSEAEITGIEKPISITPPGTRNGSGSFSPDGLSLIFASTAPDAGSGKFPADMHIFRVDGWEGALAMASAAANINLAQHALTADPPYNGECSYSNDGKWICFTSTRNGNPNIFVMHADGSHIVQITKTAGYDGGSHFSPNGKSIVYQSDRDADHHMQIFLGDLTFDLSGEITGMANERPLTHEDINTNPSWHPDGRHIIYSTSRHGLDNHELYLMKTNGRKKTRITFSPGADLFPAFSPDGRFLIWTSKRGADGTTQIFIANFQFPEGS